MKYSKAFLVKKELLTDDSKPLKLSRHYDTYSLFKRILLRLGFKFGLYK